MNLQVKIRNLAKELNRLYLLAPPPQDAALEKLIAALDAQSLDALKKELDEDTVEFKATQESLDAAQKAAASAVKELDKIREVIAATVKVINELDKMLAAASSLIR